MPTIGCSVLNLIQRFAIKSSGLGVCFYSVLSPAIFVACSRSPDIGSGRSSVEGRNAVSERSPSELADESSALRMLDELLAQGSGTPTTVDQFLEMTKARSATVRSRAVRALGHVASGDTEIIRRLVVLVRDPEPAVVAQAAAALGRIAKRQGLDSTDKRVSEYVARELVTVCSHPDATVRKAVLEALIVLNPDPAFIGPIIAETLRTADPELIVPVLGTLADMREAVAPLLQKALEDPAAAYWAGVIAQDIGPAAAAAVPALRTVIGDDTVDPTVRLQAILAIAAIGAPKGDAAVPEVIYCLASKEASLRTAAAFALGKLEATAAKPSLRKALSDASPAVASMAAWALAKLSPDEPAVVTDAVNQLKEQLANGNPTARVTVLSALAEICGYLRASDKKELATALELFLRDEDSGVRSAAASIFEQLGTAAFESLANALRDPSSRQSALAVILALREKDASLGEAVVPLLSSSDPDDIMGACLALAELGTANETVVTRLQHVLTDPTKSIDVRRSAAYTLGKLGVAAEPAATDLIAARQSDDPLLKVLANWAVARIHPTNSEVAVTSRALLTAALAEEDESIRSAAAVSLGDLGSTARDALGALERVANDDPTPAVREAAKNAMARIRGDVLQ